MELMSTNGQTLTMSSRDIAELCDKEHKNVLVDIRAMLESLGLSSADFSAQYKDPTGRSLPCFNLPKRETLILVSGYRIDLRAKIIDRWQELESRRFPTLPDLSDPVVLVQLLTEHASKRIEAEHRATVAEMKALEMKPDVDAFTRLAKADGTMCITDAAKALSIQPKHLFDYLKLKGWIYKRAGGKHWLGYQDKVQAGHLSHVTTTITASDGFDRVKEQVVVTAKGLARLAKELPTHDGAVPA